MPREFVCVECGFEIFSFDACPGDQQDLCLVCAWSANAGIDPRQPPVEVAGAQPEMFAKGAPS